MAKHRQAGELIWKRQSNTSNGKGNYAQIGHLSEAIPMCRFEHWGTDNAECDIDCCHGPCNEWTDVWLLPGATRQEAMSALIQGQYTGVAYHVNECQMFDDKNG